MKFHAVLIREALRSGRVLTGADCVDRKLDGERIMNWKGRFSDLRLLYEQGDKENGVNIPRDKKVTYHGHTFAIYYDADLMTFVEAVNRRFPGRLRNGLGRYLSHEIPYESEVADRIKGLYLKGISVPKIAKRFTQYSMGQIYRKLHAMGVKMRKPGQQMLCL